MGQPASSHSTWLAIGILCVLLAISASSAIGLTALGHAMGAHGWARMVLAGLPFALRALLIAWMIDAWAAGSLFGSAFAGRISSSPAQGLVQAISLFTIPSVGIIILRLAG